MPEASKNHRMESTSIRGGGRSHIKNGGEERLGYKEILEKEKWGGKKPPKEKVVLRPQCQAPSGVRWELSEKCASFEFKERLAKRIGGAIFTSRTDKPKNPKGKAEKIPCARR